MRVLILGGYGVFGGRLARLLLRDDHEVWVAGRDARKAAQFAADHGAIPLCVNIAGDLRGLLVAAPQVVVDAAGPFQLYGDGPPRVAAFCIANAIDYLDLSDDPAFTTAITHLDAAAKAAGRFALSGASSVPGLSSVVVAELARDLARIDLIETAILPGNRAPRGRSVVAALLSQLGAPIEIWRGGRWREARCWSQPRAHDLGDGLVRRGRLVNVPDLALFPAFFSARSVTFRAGMELWMLDAAMAAVALFRRATGVRPGRWFAALAQRVADLLEPFGTDRGGMVVSVTGQTGGRALTRTWRLVAQAGEGPFVPAVVARALLRDPCGIAPGARPCLAEVSLARITAAMSDLDIATATSQAPATSLFEAALGPAWPHLPPTVRAFHSVRDVASFSGRAEVVRGTGPLARLIAAIFRFPPATEDTPVTVTVTRDDGGETWERDFGGRRFRSRLTPAGPRRVTERFGPFAFELDLPVGDGALGMPVRRGWLLGMALPRFLLPQSNATETCEDGRFHFDVGLGAPLGGGLIVRYRGWLAPDDQAMSMR